MVDAPGADLSQLFDETGCQVLMLSRDDGELSAGEERRLQARPRLRVVALYDEGRQAALYEPTPRERPYQLRLREVSMERLVAAIRASVDHREPGN